MAYLLKRISIHLLSRPLLRLIVLGFLLASFYINSKNIFLTQTELVSSLESAVAVASGDGCSFSSNGDPACPQQPRHRSGVCRKLTSTSNRNNEARSTLSVKHVWNSLRSELLNATFDTQDNPNAQFRPWVTELFDWYTTNKLARSLAFPANSVQVQRIIEILDNYQTTGEQLRVLIMGGSVTAGHECMANQIGLTGGPRGNSPYHECAWATRLEFVLNHVLFGGKAVVEVTNLAVGGANSEVGAMVLEYGLFPDNFTLPHIVLSAFSANDATFSGGEDVLFQHMQSFVQAALKLRCDADLPMVIMVDDFIGTMRPDEAIEHYANIQKIAAWYQLMSISYPNVVRHAIYGNLFELSVVNPLMSSPTQSIHGGLAFHLGMTWTVLFNILHAIIETCNEDSTTTVTGYNGNTTKTLVVEELPPQSIGQLTPTIIFPETTKEWRKRVASEKDRCRNGTPSGPTCTYAWMVNRLTGVSSPQHVKREMNPVLKDQDGWNAKGYPIRQPRTGWYADRENATFFLEFSNVIVETRFATILYLKSYTENYKNSVLNITAQVIHQGPTNGTVAQSSFNVSGYHDSKTSVHFPHKMELPDGGARVGDTIRLNFKLLGGNAFKIAGIALCSR